MLGLASRQLIVLRSDNIVVRLVDEAEHQAALRCQVDGYFYSIGPYGCSEQNLLVIIYDQAIANEPDQQALPALLKIAGVDKFLRGKRTG